ncbi:MAG: hypothetical protein PHV02_03260 [Rhodocyclaceae bacterium]|nr:hypothetical protein [Rhodocyclaceae bacterium]
MPEKKPKEPNLTQTAILERTGWTKTLLLKLLGEPDLRKKIHGRTQLACLYREVRVLEAEGSAAFAAAQDGIQKRKAAGKKAVETKIEKLMLAVAEMRVTVQHVGIDKVRRDAIRSYNDWHWDSCMPASLKSEPEFLDRITVNYIRHELTDYDYALEEVAGKVGVQIAIDTIRDKIYASIANAYPVLAQECKKQLDARQ